jgi:hypothetical protein
MIILGNTNPLTDILLPSETRENIKTITIIYFADKLIVVSVFLYLAVLNRMRSEHGTVHRLGTGL